MLGRTSTHKTYFVNFILFILSFIFCIIFTEIIGQIFFKDVIPDTHGYYSPDNTLGWTYAKGKIIKIENVFGEPVKFKVSPEGFRDWDYGRICKECIRILYLGDSVTGALQVNQLDHFIQKIDEYVQKQGIKTQGFNYGVNGYSADQILILLKQILAKIEPRVIVYTFVENDIYLLSSDNYKIENIRYGKPMVEFNKGDEWVIKNPPYMKKEFPLSLKEKLKLKSFIISRLRRLVRIVRTKSNDNISSTNFISFKKKNLNAGWDDMIRERKGNNGEGYPNNSWDKFLKIVKAMDQTAKAHNAILLVFPWFDPWILLPNSRQILIEGGADPDQPQKNLIQFMEKNQIKHTEDIFEYMQKIRKENNGGEDLFFIKDETIYDGHLSKKGHVIVANYLGNWIIKTIKK